MNEFAANAADYRAALERFLAGAGEDALSSAYEIGRRALADGLGLLDMASIHNESVARCLQRKMPGDPAMFMQTVGSFFSESLSPFEMRYRSVDDANTALRRLNELLEEEARRVAHALHDQAGSILASARLELNLAAKKLPAGAREPLALVEELLEETGEQLRHFSHELRPVILDDLGLDPALEFLTQGVAQRTGLRVSVACKLHERLPAVVETAVYRIVQEALNNTLLHGGDSPAVTVSIERQGSHLRCIIADEGSGFDVDEILGGRGQRCLGLLGMQERASAVNGKCNIKSAPGRGTTIEVVVPVQTPKAFATAGKSSCASS